MNEQNYMGLTDCNQPLIRGDEFAFQTENTLVKPRKLNMFEFIWMEISRFLFLIYIKLLKIPKGLFP